MKDAFDACEDLDEDEKRLELIKAEPVSSGSSSQRRKTLCVSESGLYQLIFKSRKPEAKAFKKWICREVIPALRKGDIVINKLTCCVVLYQ